MTCAAIRCTVLASFKRPGGALTPRAVAPGASPMHRQAYLWLPWRFRRFSRVP